MKKSIVFLMRSLLLACQIAVMPKGRFEAMISNLEGNYLGNRERATFFREVESLAKACRSRGPLTVVTKRRKVVVRTLIDAYNASLVLWQMNHLD